MCSLFSESLCWCWNLFLKYNVSKVRTTDHTDLLNSCPQGLRCNHLSITRRHVDVYILPDRKTPTAHFFSQKHTTQLLNKFYWYLKRCRKKGDFCGSILKRIVKTPVISFYEEERLWLILLNWLRKLYTISVQFRLYLMKFVKFTAWTSRKSFVFQQSMGSIKKQWMVLI